MPARPARPAKPGGISLYGCSWPTEERAEVELECIRRGGQWVINGRTCGQGLPYHVMTFAKLVWPWFAWHRWATDLILPELCRKKARVGIFGPSSSGKSCLCGMTALTLYFAHPDNTTVIVTSTTKDDLETRIWGEIKMLFKEAKERFPWLPGHLTESKQMISTDGKGEEDGREFRNGIMGKPVRKGGTWVGLSSIVGIKNDNFIAVGDEAHLMNEGFNDSFANLESNPNFRGWELGNLNELDSQLGQACEPELGWDSLPDSDKSRVYRTRFHNGTAIQLVGKDSPNLDYPEGAEPYPKLIGREYIARMAHNYGVDTPLYNMFAAGKIPRGTMENRVITDLVVARHNGYEPVTWGHESLTRGYCADISYTAEHGDRTVGRPFSFGRDTDGNLRLIFPERPLVYTPSDRSSASIEEQIASQMMAECRRLGIPPEHVFFDGSGRSSFTAAIMRLWSVSVNAIDFGGSASTRPNFIGKRYAEDLDSRRKKGDLLPCNEVFGKFVSELWFAFRYLVEARQLGEMDRDTVKEGEKRLWKLTAGNRMDVESKRDMKLRVGRSPDLFDCVVCGVEGARRLGFPLGQLAAPEKRRSHWLSKLQKEIDEAHAATALAA